VQQARELLAPVWSAPLEVDGFHAAVLTICRA
jgi:hypothetical protein